MSRPSVLLMFAGAFALLVAVVVLWRSTRSDSAPVPPSKPGELAAPSTPAPVAAATPSPPAARAQKRSITAGAPPTITATRTDTPPAKLEPAAPAPAAGSGDNLHFGAIQIHAQTSAVEPLVRECVEKAAVAGARPSGVAYLTYTVVKHDDGVIVDDTGFDADKTTLKNDGLLSCLHQTAKAMKFEGLPYNAPQIFVARQVTLENGKITEYKHVTFSYGPLP